MKRKFTAALTVFILIFLFSVPAFANGGTSANPFPVTYSAFNRIYTFTGCEIGTGAEGGVTVTLFGSGYGIPGGYNTADHPDNIVNTAYPALCGFTSGGAAYECRRFETNPGSLVFIFDTDAEPENITLTNKDTGAVIISFAAENINAEPAAALQYFTNDVFPLTFTPFGKTVTVGGYILGLDEFNDAYIQLIGNGNNDYCYNEEGGRFVMGYAEIEIDGIIYEPNWYSQTSFSFGNTYDTADFNPDKIIIYNNDTGEQIAEFNHSDSAGTPIIFDSLPVNIEAYGNSYGVERFEAGKNETGRTVVTLYGSGYKEINSDEDGNLLLPAAISFIVTKPYLQVYDFDYCFYDDTGGNFMRFDFVTDDEPEMIVLSNNETGEIIGIYFLK